MSLHLGNNQRRAYPYKQTHIILKIAVHYTHKTQTYRGGGRFKCKDIERFRNNNDENKVNWQPKDDVIAPTVTE